MVAGSNHCPGEGGQWGGQEKCHPGAQPLGKYFKPHPHFSSKMVYIRDINLIYNSSHHTANNVANEEETGDPGAEKEVDLNWIVSRCAVHHLGDCHAGEGEPTPYHGGPE